SHKSQAARVPGGGIGVGGEGAVGRPQRGRFGSDGDVQEGCARRSCRGPRGGRTRIKKQTGDRGLQELTEATGRREPEQGDLLYTHLGAIQRCFVRPASTDKTEF